MASTLTAPLRTTVVGSYPQPDWLVDRTLLGSRLPPRIRAREIWRVADPWLAQAQDDATLIAIRDMERAGIDLISDGEIGVRATPTGLPPRSTAWTSTTPVRPSTGPVIPTPSRASSDRFGAANR